MRTKYILHGGVTGERSESNKSYFRGMIAGVVEPKVLLVYFAREDNEYDYLYDRDTGNFAWANPGVEIQYTIATKENFADQVKAHNVVFFMGGETQKLLDTVRETEFAPELCEGKVISGSSAGAYLMSTWYYTNSGKEIRAGLGLLPVAVWAHYRADRGNKYWLPEDEIHSIEKELKEKAGNSEVVLLHEQESVVYN